MVEIRVGSELDRAVAEAVGLIFDVSDGQVELLVLSEEDRDVVEAVPFRPSTDLNDAFFAAEKSASDFYGCVELPPCITVDNRTGWKCTIEESPEGRGSTPALAICAAILKLAK